MNHGLVITYKWTCQKCGATVSHIVDDALPYADPIAVPPDGWDYLADGNTYACHACVEREKKAE